MSLPPDDSEHDPVHATEPEPEEDYDDYEESDDVKEFRALFYENGSFLATLANDVRACEGLILAANGEHAMAFARRTFVRTVFAEIEGLCSSALFWARYYSGDDAHEALKSQYSDEERAVLRGVVPRLDDNGVAGVEKLKYSTQRSILFALSLVGRAVGRWGRGAEPPTVNKGDGGWASLLKAIKVRDRLMHPKHRSDVLVTDEELETVRFGRKWFMWTFERRNGSYSSHAMAELGEDWRTWGDGKI